MPGNHFVQLLVPLSPVLSVLSPAFLPCHQAANDLLVAVRLFWCPFTMTCLLFISGHSYSPYLVLKIYYVNQEMAMPSQATD